MAAKSPRAKRLWRHGTVLIRRSTSSSCQTCLGTACPLRPATPLRRLTARSFPMSPCTTTFVCQHRLLTERLDIKRIKLVVGFSMGAQQAYQWAALYPDTVEAIAPICGSARTSPHNYLFLEGVKAALTADATFAEGWYQTPPIKGLRALARVYMGWAFSQDFFREREYRKMGLAS